MSSQNMLTVTLDSCVVSGNANPSLDCPDVGVNLSNTVTLNVHACAIGEKNGHNINGVNANHLP